MGLERSITSRHDGRNIPAFYQIKEIRLMLESNRAEIYGNVYASAQAFTDRLHPIDSFTATITDLEQLLLTHPSNIERDAYGWLKTLPEFVGAVDRVPPVAVVVPSVERGS